MNTQKLPLLGAGMLFGLAACSAKHSAEAPPALVVAQTVHAGAGSEALAIRYPVEVAARYANAMSFRVPGKLVERSVRLGDFVHKGETLARLDPADAQRQAAAAQASLDAAEHRLSFAKQQLDRDTAQSAENLIAANQLEQTQDAYSSALAAQEQAADQWAVARNNLAYNTLIADHDGVITSENADTGQVVAAGQTVFGLAWSGDIDVVLDAAAGSVGAIVPGQSASVTFPALRGRRFEAHVREVAPAADPLSRTYRVKLTLNQPGSGVRLGMTGDAVLAPAADDSAAPSFRLASTALFHRGKEPAVWVIRSSNSTLELRPVQVRSYAERGILVTQGLQDGDTVVVAGVHTVYDGERVKPVKPLFEGEGESAAEAGQTP